MRRSGLDMPRVLGAVWVPLDRAMLCLRDETVFDADERWCQVGEFPGGRIL